jgi:NAD-dependent DNA ligase
MSEAYKQQCVYFCSKLGIDFAGYGNIKALSQYIDNPYISYTNLCLLPKDVYENAIGVNGVKMYESLHKQVENATPTQLADATGCFGEGIGEKKLQKIVDVYNDLPYDYDKVIKTEGWAEKSTEQYMNHYASWIEMTDFFIKNDMWNGFSKPITLSDKYKDVKVVFTGVRNIDLEESIRKNGGKVLTSFTKECNLVIAKDPMSSSGKLKKARENGVEIISLADALNRFEKVEKEVVPLEKLDNPLVNMLKLN